MIGCQIVGIGANPAGQQHGFLLTPLLIPYISGLTAGFVEKGKNVQISKTINVGDQVIVKHPHPVQIASTKSDEPAESRLRIGQHGLLRWLAMVLPARV